MSVQKSMFDLCDWLISGDRGDAGVTADHGERQRSKHQRGRSKQTAAQLSWLFICSSWLVNIFLSRFQTQQHRFRRETEKSHNACSRRKKATFKDVRLISSTSELMITSAFCFQKRVFFFKLTTDTSEVNSHALRSCTP